MRTLTRDTQTSSHLNLTEDIAIKLSATTKRLNLIESHITTIKARARGPSPTPTHKPIEDHTTNYWRDSANTLSEENTNLTRRLSKLEEEHRQLRSAMTRSSEARKELEKRLNEANKEIFHLSAADPSRRIIPRQPAQLKFAVMPPNTQKRDAAFWFQTCRSMEAQYVQRNAELEAKIDELMEAVSAKRKRTDAASEDR